RRQGDIGPRLQCGDTGDDLIDVLAGQRLTAGETDLIDTELLTAMRTKRTISSPVIAASRDMNSTPSAGMQEVQRRLQKAVRDPRRSRARRPKVSRSESSLWAVNASPGSTAGVLITGTGRPIVDISSSSSKSVWLSSSHDYSEDASVAGIRDDRSTH